MPEDFKDVVARDGIDRIDREMSDFRSETRQAITSIRHEVSEGFKALADRLDADTRMNRPQVFPMFAAMIGIVGLAFTFTTIITQPLRDGQEDLKGEVHTIKDHENRRLNELPGEYYNAGRNVANIERNMEMVINLRHEVSRLKERVASSESTIKAQGSLLRDVDMGGSRIWVSREDGQ